MTHLLQAVGIGVLFAMLSLLAKESGSKTAAVQVAFAGVVLFGMAMLRFLPVFETVSSLYQKLLTLQETDAQKAELLARQIYSLSLLAQRKLSAEELEQFLSSSFSLLELF